MSFTPDHAGATVLPSPNFGERLARGADGPVIDTLILHYTGMESEEAAIRWLASEESQVSAHYVVREDGSILQMVAEDKRAWHAGKSIWKGLADINSCSIGIEISNGGHPYGLPDYPDIQIDAVIALCRDIIARRQIPASRVLAHSDIAPGRKVDPGEKFPWGRLHAAGVGLWVEPAPIVSGRFFQRGDEGAPIEALQAMFAMLGFDTPISGVFCERTEKDVRAFQLHYRPERVDGIADQSTIETLNRLLRASSN